MARPRKPLVIDYANSDPFRGLPNRFPMRHSRFSPEPSEEAARIPASEPTTNRRQINAAVKQVKSTPEAQESWQELLRSVKTAQKSSRKR